MIEQLAARVFAARNSAHRAHWRTGSYARHMALGDFYDATIEAIDEIVEVYQGRFGLIPAFTVADAEDSNIVTYLRGETQWIEENRAAIGNGSTAVENLIDELLAVYRRTLYKLEYLN